MNRVKTALAASLTIALGVAASAALIGVSGFLIPSNVPRTQFTGPNVAGALDFNAATRSLKLNISDGPSVHFSSLFIVGAPLKPHFLAPTPNSLSLNINVLTPDGGTYTGNGAPHDFVLMGSVDINSDGVIDGSESGTLLTGALLQFGFNNLPVTPGNPNGTPDNLDFRFAVTGGILAPRYAGKDIGVREIMLASTWPNANVGGSEFLASFQANASGDIVPIPCGGSIGDFVWNDLNRDGVQEPGEPGLNGIAVRLRDQNSAIIKTAVTANGGQGNQPGYYNFSGLCLGAYSVEVDTASAQALGFVPTTAGAGGNPSRDSNLNGSPVTIAAGNYVTGDQTVDFGFKSACTGTIGDSVWHDLNRNGLKDPGEPGFQGWSVRLLDAGGVQIGAPVLTGPNGSYQFVGLCAGSYRIDVVPEPGFALTLTNQGTDRTADSNIPLAELIPLANDFAADSSIDFGYTGSCEGVIGDYVWFDSNHDGLQDANETGIDGLTVTLNGPGGGKTTTTGVNPNDSTKHGYYQFTGACTGSYTIDVQAPGGFTPSADHAASDGALDSDGPAGGGPATVALANDLSAEHSIDFGFISCPGQIGDRVWQDTNLNGVQDPGEPGYPGVVVNLRRPFDNSILQSTTTGLDGKYGFSGLCPADYLVEVVPPAESTPSPTGGGPDVDGNVNPAPVTLTLIGDVDLTIDFGFLPHGSLGGRVWNDANGDGVQDASEGGLVGWTLSVRGPGYSSTQITGANGAYVFANLPAGAYTVCASAPSGFVPTYDFDGVATPACATRTVTALDVHLTGTDFGYRDTTLATGSIGNFVWQDLNNNGIQEFGEPGMQGAPLTISGPTLPAGYLTTTTADANGAYQFSGLPAGTYTVTLPVGSFQSVPIGQGTASTTCPAGGGTGAQYCDSNGAPGEATSGFVSATVTLATNSSSDQTVDFGLYSPPNESNGGSGVIGNFVWLDQNQNGLQDTNEPGIPGITVNIAGPGYTFSTQTDANGRYSFRGLLAGTYQVSVVPGPSYALTQTGQGSAGTMCTDGAGAAACDSNANPAVVVLGNKGLDLTVDFGLRPSASALTLTKSVDKTTAPAGSTLVYTLTYKNTGGAAATNVTIADVVPPNTTFVSATGGGVNTDGIVKWTVGSVAGGATGSVTLTVRLAAVFQACHVDGDNDDHEHHARGHRDGDKCAHETSKGCSSTNTVSNSATIASTEKPAPVSSNTVTTSVATTPLPILVLSKTVNKATANPGDTLVYTLAGKNLGNLTETDIVITDVLPAGTTFVSTTGGGVYSNGTVTWKIPSAPTGAAVAGTLTVKLNASFPFGTTTISNTYNVTSTQIPTPVVSPAAITTVTVAPKPALTLTKAVSATTAAKGGTLVYTLNYKNTGTAAATSVTITDQLPDNTTFVTATGGGVFGKLNGNGDGNGNPNGNGNGNGNAGVKWTIPAVAAGATGSVTFTVKVSTTVKSRAAISNTAQVTSAEITAAVVSNTVTSTVN